MSDRLATLLHQTRLLIANELCRVNYDGVHNHIWDGIYYVDSDGDDSDGENNNESVRASGFKCLTDDARTFLISRDASHLTGAYSSRITFILVRGNKSFCVVSRDKSQDIVLRLDDTLARHQGYVAEGLEMQPLAAATLSVGAGDKTAISALTYLYAEDLKANEIEVRVVKEGSREKESLEIEEIEEYLSRVQGDEHPSKLHEGIEKSADGDIEEHISRLLASAPK